MDIQWSLVLFTALTGLGDMMFLLICLNALLGKTDKGEFEGSIISVVLLAVGGLASVTHLSHPDRMLNALQHPTSGIFTEAVLVGLLAVCAIVFALMVKRGIRGGALKAISVIGIILGILMAFMAGQSYIMAAIPAWNTELLPLGYLGTAAAEGAAAYLLLIVLRKAEADSLKFYSTVLAGAGCVSLVTGLLYGIASGAFTEPVGAALTICTLIFGGAAPAICGYLGMKKPANIQTLAAIAFACAFIGAVSYRCCMWVIGANLYGFFGLI